HAEERLLEYQEQLRALASELSLAEARERRRIAGELHDGIGQSLALAQIKLDALRADKRAGVFAEQIAETRNIIDEAVADVRALTFDLTPPALYELGFVAAARSLCERLENEHGLVIGFSDDGRAKLVSEDVRVILFRALRETLINVIKHAGASHVEVSVARDNEHMHVDVADDGVGFDATQLASDGGVSGRFGLFNVQERLEHVGGRLQVESAPGHGTHVTLVAPLDGSEESVGEASG
ncbi:MAG: sensor histidine kinase, partial [Armatimonadota bacterium]